MFMLHVEPGRVFAVGSNYDWSVRGTLKLVDLRKGEKQPTGGPADAILQLCRWGWY